jgi:aspartate/methionine/tyrosine aminotransferase
MFVSKGSAVLSSDPCWDNYSLIFEVRRGGRLRGVPFFGEAGEDGGLDLGTIGDAVAWAAKTGAVRIVFNFPNNPSGYSPTGAEAEKLADMLRGAAESGADVLAICDDAYFGLFYEENIAPESLFARFAGLHERIVAVKIDGPIKEDYTWGLRTGFLTFGSRGLSSAHYEALTRKLTGAIRSSVSSSNTPAQHFMLKAMEDSRTPGEKERYRGIMRSRYTLVKSIVRKRRGHPVLSPLPFNSGYFMCFRCTGVDAETLRRELLTRHGIGTISLGERYLRVAFSGIDGKDIPEVYRLIYETAEKLGN